MAPKKSKKTAVKKPSKKLTGMISGYNRENEAKNKLLMKKRKAIIAQAKKEGFSVNVR